MHDMLFSYCISLSSSFRIFSLAFRLFLFSRACVLKISFMDTKHVCWRGCNPGFAATGLAQLTRWIVITSHGVIFQSSTLAILYSVNSAFLLICFKLFNLSAFSSNMLLMLKSCSSNRIWSISITCNQFCAESLFEDEFPFYELISDSSSVGILKFRDVCFSYLCVCFGD